MPPRPLVLATRGSALALAQAREAEAALAAKFRGKLMLETITVKTSGDVLKDAALRDFGGKGAFVREVDERVLAGDADVAVHSLKDVPTNVHEELAVAAILRRRAFTDALVSASPLAAMPHGAHIGTSSVRRRALLLRARPDLRVSEIRGNVPTRVQKWRDGAYDGVVLSTAGLRRLAIEAPHEELDPAVFVPEPGQGAVACVCRAGSPAERFLRAIDDARTRAEVTAEREVLRALGGGCVAPVGVHATKRGDRLRVRAIVLSLDGRRAITLDEWIPATNPARGAQALASALERMGGDVLLEEARKALG